MTKSKQTPDDPRDEDTLPAHAARIAEKSKLAHEYLRHGALAREAATHDASKGNRTAFARLLHEAELWNEAVAAAYAAQPESAKQLAAKRSTWPGNVAGHPAAIDDQIAYLRDLGLGSQLRVKAASSVPWRGRKRLDSPAQAISVDLWDWLIKTRKAGATKATTKWEREACALPDLVDEKSRRAWFDCAWAHYESVFNGDVLRDPMAAKIGGKMIKGRNKPAGYAKDQVYKASRWLTK